MIQIVISDPDWLRVGNKLAAKCALFASKGLDPALPIEHMRNHRYEHVFIGTALSPEVKEYVQACIGLVPQYESL